MAPRGLPSFRLPRLHGLCAVLLTGCALASPAFAQSLDEDAGSLLRGPLIVGEDEGAAGAQPGAPVVFDAPVDDATRELDALREAGRNRAARLRNRGTQSRGEPVGAADDRSQRATRTATVDLADPGGALRPILTAPVPPVQIGTGATPEDDPYAPLGIRTGSFLWFPLIEQSFGYTSNATAIPGGSDDVFALTRGDLQVRSDWARHEVFGRLAGSYQTFLSGDAGEIPTLAGELRLRIDAARSTRLSAGVGYDLRTESVTSPSVDTGVTVVSDRPQVDTMSAFAEAEHDAGRLGVRLRGSIARSVYDSLRLADGTVQSQADRDATLALATLRLSHDTGATLTPFVQGTLGWRVHDEEVDRNGANRDSVIHGIQAGVAIGGGEKLTGEIALGYRAEAFESASIGTLDGFTVDGRIDWSPVRLSTLRAEVQTAFSPATEAGTAGTVTYAGSLVWLRRLRTNLTLESRVRAAFASDGDGRDDTTLQAEIGLEWQLNRTAALFGAAGYETVSSSDPDADYDAAFARFGLRLRR